MTARPQDITDFLDTLAAAVLARAEPDGPAGQVMKTVSAALEAPMDVTGGEPSRLPVCDHLTAGFATACNGPAPVAKAARALHTIEPALTWWARPGADAVGADFANGHANTSIVGPKGLIRRDDVQIGVSLIAPNIRYPDHHHPPEEIYLVLSPGEWRNSDQPWWEPGIGGIVHNPPGIVHAMRSDTHPLLAIWCLC